MAGQVFDRYGEAAVRADTTLAEKFLRTGNLKAVTSTVDPLGLVQIQGGVPRIRTDHKALLSIRDLLDKQGTVEGRRLLDTFSDAPSAGRRIRSAIWSPRCWWRAKSS